MNKYAFTTDVLTANPHRVQSADGLFNNFTQNYRVVRAPIITKKIPFSKTISYLVHYFSFMFFSLLWGMFRTGSSYDYVMVSSPPLFIGITGWILAKFKRAKFVLDIRDLWPDFAVSAGMLSKEGILYKLGKKMERFLYFRSDLITSVSKPMRDYISETSSDYKKVGVIYNAIDTHFLKDFPEEIYAQSKIKDSLSLEDKILITYLGNIGLAQGLDAIIEAATILKEKSIKNIIFSIIGGGVLRASLEQKAAARGLNNVVFEGPFSREAAFKHMVDSSALLINLKGGGMLCKTIPSKVFDYLYANKPILYGIEGEGKEILSSLHGNLYFKPSNADSLVKSVMSLSDNYPQYLKNAQNNRNYLLENYSREKMCGKLIKVLQSI